MYLARQRLLHHRQPGSSIFTCIVNGLSVFLVGLVLSLGGAGFLSQEHSGLAA